MNKVRLVQQEPTTFSGLPSLLEDFSNRRSAFESTGRSGVGSGAGQGLPGIGGRAGDQRTLYAGFSFQITLSFSLPRLDGPFISAGSTVCFVLASLNYPEGIRVIFGKSAAEEINWDSLSTVGRNLTNDDGGLSMILRMTRQDDLGLGQLLFQ